MLRRHGIFVLAENIFSLNASQLVKYLSGKSKEKDVDENEKMSS
jgi:hypothetical protein